MSDDHGPQRQPASVPQIEAQMKQLNGELDAAYHVLDELQEKRHELLMRENERLRTHLAEAIGFLTEVVASGVEFEDWRVRYKVLHVPTVVLRSALTWLKAMKGEDTDDTH